MKKIIVHMGTYLPFKDGISTFTNNLLEAQKQLHPHLEFKVVAMDLVGYKLEEYPEEVAWVIEKDKNEDYKRVAKLINENKNISCLYLQHEYGIFGGERGEYIVEFVKSLKIPVFITLHTVLPEPDKKMFEVTEKLIGLSVKIVVMTMRSKKILQKVYGTEPAKINVIRHGIHPTVFVSPAVYKAQIGIRDRFILGTFGFLGTGKGIEYVIRALPKVVEKFPNTEYWILGKTHPIVLKNNGESYRESLMKEIEELGLSSNVKFYNKYLSVSQILRFLKMVDLYIVTALEPTQAVSGTFSYALGTGRPLVSTSFLQAQEVMKRDFGELVGFGDPGSYASAITKLLSDNKRRERIQKRAYRKTRGMLWPNVANLYLELNSNLADFPPLKLDHLERMTDDFGLFQFAKGIKPDPEFGYTLDDNARALIFVSFYYKHLKTKKILNLIQIYLNFIEFCQKESGEFLNYVNGDRETEEVNPWQNSEDANGRALWALGAVISQDWLPDRERQQARDLWERWHETKIDLRHPRAKAFYIKGLWYLRDSVKIDHEASGLLKYYSENSGGKWDWFLQDLTYANGVLPEAMFLAYEITKDRQYLKVAQRTLNFLISHTFVEGLYIPIGQSGWYPKNKERAYFDQQPEDPYSMISLLLTAQRITHRKKFFTLAKRCMYWFYGNNLLGESLYDSKSGGSRDGLTSKGVNTNQGAESTISYLLSLQLIKEHE